MLVFYDCVECCYLFSGGIGAWLENKDCTLSKESNNTITYCTQLTDKSYFSILMVGTRYKTHIHNDYLAAILKSNQVYVNLAFNGRGGVCELSLFFVLLSSTRIFLRDLWFSFVLKIHNPACLNACTIFEGLTKTLFWLTRIACQNKLESN